MGHMDPIGHLLDMFSSCQFFTLVIFAFCPTSQEGSIVHIISLGKDQESKNDFY